TPGSVVANAATQPIPGAGNAGQFLTGLVGDVQVNLTAASQAATTGQVVTFDFDLYTPGNSGGPGLGGFAAYRTGSGSIDAFGIKLYRDGTVRYYSGSDSALITAGGLGSYPLDQWIHVQVVADFGAAQHWSANVGGFTFDAPFNYPSVSNLAQVYFAA